MDVRDFFGRFASSVTIRETFTFRVNGGKPVTVHGRENLSSEQRAVVEASEDLNKSASELLKRVLKL
jgi:hypothetical protein